ncbi:MAG: PH domain-containing protein [Dehalococcoidia bacterium]
MLIEGKGLIVERPQRIVGTLTGVLPAALALALAVALAFRAAGWPISWPAYLAYLGAGLLLLVALLFAFWAYACSTLHYLLDRSGLLIRWGPLRHFIPIDRIEKLIPGRGEHQPRVQGLSWWGHHIGRGVVHGLGEVLFFSTHRSPEELVYVQTATATYGLSPQDSARFSMQVQRLQEAGGARSQATTAAVHRDTIASHPIWSDRTIQALLFIAVALNLALFGYIFAIYPGLSDQIAIAFPPLGEVADLESKREILQIPLTALAILGLNVMVALGFQRWERTVAYILLLGGISLQLMFWVATGIAVHNA